MSRWLVGMSGDKDAMIAHLEKCEKRMLKQFAEIKELAKNAIPADYAFSLERIVTLCDMYLDKRSDKQKMQDELDELRERIKQLEGDSE
jgi:hypothetical protein